MQDNRLEHKFSTELEGLNLQPSPAVWKNIEMTLDEDERRRKPFWLWFFPLLLLLLLGIWLLQNQNTGTPLHAKVDIHTPKFVDSPYVQTHSAPHSLDIAKLNNGEMENRDQKGSPFVNKKVGASLFPKAEGQVQTVSSYSKRKGTLSAPVSVNHSAIQSRKKKKKEKGFVGVKVQTVFPSSLDNDSAVFNQDSVLEHYIASKINRENFLKKARKPNPQELNFPSPGNLLKQKSKIVSNKNWQFGFGLEVGRSALATLGMSNKGSINFSNDNNTPAVGIRTSIYDPTKNGLVLGANFYVTKPLNEKWSFISGNSYQYTNIKLPIRDIKTDSSLATSTPTVTVYDYAVAYDVHAICIPTYAAYNFLPSKRFSFEAGLLHRFIFVEQSQTLPSPFSNQKKYQPMFHLGLQWKKQLGKQNEIAVGPYVNLNATSAAGNYKWWQLGFQTKINLKKK